MPPLQLTHSHHYTLTICLFNALEQIPPVCFGSLFCAHYNFDYNYCFSKHAAAHSIPLIRLCPKVHKVLLKLTPEIQFLKTLSKLLYYTIEYANIAYTVWCRWTILNSKFWTKCWFECKQQSKFSAFLRRLTIYIQIHTNTYEYTNALSSIYHLQRITS